MKSRYQITQELESLRHLQRSKRHNGTRDDLICGSIQALGWILGQCESPSELEKRIDNIVVIDGVMYYEEKVV